MFFIKICFTKNHKCFLVKQIPFILITNFPSVMIRCPSAPPPCFSFLEGLHHTVMETPKAIRANDTLIILGLPLKSASQMKISLADVVRESFGKSSPGFREMLSTCFAF